MAKRIGAATPISAAAKVGFFVDGGECSINPHDDICKREIMLVGSWASNIRMPTTFCNWRHGLIFR